MPNCYFPEKKSYGYVSADMVTMVDEESEQSVEVLNITFALPQLWKCSIKMTWNDFKTMLNVSYI
jgi:hypothetical protein